MRLKTKIARNYFIILILLFIDSLGNGVSSVILPQIIYKNELGIKIFGLIATFQSVIGIFILLPQASFIKKFGEIFCIRIGVIANIIIYTFYSMGTFFTVSIGKFTEGFADRLLNSSLSKLAYDYTDESHNRGRYRSLLDVASNVGHLLGPILVGVLLINGNNMALQIVVVIMVIGILFSFRYFKQESPVKQISICNHKEKTKFLDTYFIDHMRLFSKNKKIMFLSLPAFLFSCFDIFESLLLGQYLLGEKMFSTSQLALFWSVISAITLIFQYPLGILSDKNKSLLLYLSNIFIVIGFGGLIVLRNKYIIILFASIIYIGCLGYSMAMTVLFGDMTTKENRLSESEVYRMIRLIGSGIFSLGLSIIFGYSQTLVVIMIMIFTTMASIIAVFCNKYMYNQ